jgi:hypothetical protein
MTASEEVYLKDAMAQQAPATLRQKIDELNKK